MENVSAHARRIFDPLYEILIKSNTRISSRECCSKSRVLISLQRIYATDLIRPDTAALILQILKQYHDSPLAAHHGVARTHALVAQYFKWTGLATAVDGYVRSCDACQRNKVVRHAPFGLLNPLPIPSRPGPACPSTGSRICRPAITMMLSWSLWTG